MSQVVDKPVVQESEKVLDPAGAIAMDLKDAFVVYMKHMVNPSLKGFTDYARDEVRHHRPDKRKWFLIENYITQLWKNR
jgi:hypothetical protein